MPAADEYHEAQRNSRFVVGTSSIELLPPLKKGSVVSRVYSNTDENGTGATIFLFQGQGAAQYGYGIPVRPGVSIYDVSGAEYSAYAGAVTAVSNVADVTLSITERLVL